MRVHSVLRLTAVNAVIFGMLLCACACAATDSAAPAAPAATAPKDATAPAPAAAATPPAAAPAAGADEVVARVEDVQITRKELDDAIKKAVDMYRQLAAAGQAPPGFDPNTPPTDDQKRKVLDGLVNFRIVDILAKKSDIKVADTEIDERINMVKEKQGLKSDEDLSKLLQQHNLTIDKLKAQFKDDLTRQHFAETVTKDIKITDQEIDEAYNKGKAEGKMVLNEESLDVATILVRVTGTDEKVWTESKKKIAAIRERVTKGKEDFQKVAGEVSEDPSLKQNGGVYPYVTRKSAPFGPDFGAAAFLVPAGEVSEPFRTGAGWHIVKVVEKHEPGPLPLDNKFVRENLKSRLLAAKSKEAMDKTLADARAKMKVEILLPAFTPLALPAAPDAAKKDANPLLVPGST